MTIPALKLHIRSHGAAANGPHVNCVVQLDGTQIMAVVGPVTAESRELGVAVLEAAYSRCVYRIRKAVSQVFVTIGTGTVHYGRKIGAAAMFGVASRANGCRDLRRVMSGAIVAIEAGAICGSR